MSKLMVKNGEKMHSAIQVAKRIIELGKQDNRSYTPMQLLKLVYIAHGWMLGLYKRPLIRENVEAWKYGPVITELYHEVKKFRSQPVDDINKLSSIDFLFGTEPEFDEFEEDIIKQVSSKYGQIDGIKLSMLTHTEGTPWHLTWHSGHSIISNDVIAHHYHELYKKYSQKQ